MGQADRLGCDMPTNRTRRSRKKAALPPQIARLFSYGCGKAKYSEAEARALWKQYGRQFLDSLPPEKAACPFFLKVYGPPEDIGVNDAGE